MLGPGDCENYELMVIPNAASLACWCCCSTHVASVLQMTHMIMVHGGVLKSQGADRLTLLASYIAALVHDFEHSGLNNDFLIKTSHDLVSHRTLRAENSLLGLGMKHKG